GCGNAPPPGSRRGRDAARWPCRCRATNRSPARFSGYYSYGTPLQKLFNIMWLEDGNGGCRQFTTASVLDAAVECAQAVIALQRAPHMDTQHAAHGEGRHAAGVLAAAEQE